METISPTDTVPAVVKVYVAIALAPFAVTAICEILIAMPVLAGLMC